MELNTHRIFRLSIINNIINKMKKQMVEQIVEMTVAVTPIADAMIIFKGVFLITKKNTTNRGWLIKTLTLSLGYNLITK